MYIKFDENNKIIEYSEFGEIDGAENWTGSIPEGFTIDENYMYYIKTYNENLNVWELVFSQDLKDEADNIRNLKIELTQLYDWFVYYSRQFEEYSRCQRMNVVYDKDISVLDLQADINKTRINEVLNLIS